MLQLELPFNIDKKWIFDCPDCGVVTYWNEEQGIYCYCIGCDFDWFVPYVKDEGWLYYGTARTTV